MARIAAGFLLALACAGGTMSAVASDAPASATPIRFGILPIGSAAESLEQWRPLLDDLHKRLGHPVVTVSVGSYGGLSEAVNAQRVDVAFLSGGLAVTAVSRQHMQVFAQFARSDGVKGNVASMVVRADSPIRNLDDLLSAAGRELRYARGEYLSVTGYIVPEATAFAPRGLNSDMFFRDVHVGNHQDNLLAVVNGEAGVTSTNTPDMDLFRRNFPKEAAQLRVIWRSMETPSGVLVVRDGMPASLRRELVDFLLSYGKGAGKNAERERTWLARIPNLGTFEPATNQVLQPFVDLHYTLLRQQAEHGQWVNRDALQARLAQIEKEHRHAMQLLLADHPGDPAATAQGRSGEAASFDP